MRILILATTVASISINSAIAQNLESGGLRIGTNPADLISQLEQKQANYSKNYSRVPVRLTATGDATFFSDYLGQVSGFRAFFESGVARVTEGGTVYESETFDPQTRARVPAILKYGELFYALYSSPASGHRLVVLKRDLVFSKQSDIEAGRFQPSMDSILQGLVTRYGTPNADLKCSSATNFRFLFFFFRGGAQVPTKFQESFVVGRGDQRAFWDAEKALKLDIGLGRNPAQPDYISWCDYSSALNRETALVDTQRFTAVDAMIRVVLQAGTTADFVGRLQITVWDMKLLRETAATDRSYIDSEYAKAKRSGPAKGAAAPL
ncbi:hypothetical protein GJW-30_1_01800 [Variibacter gotjawalensis]|uniref:Uncharacterized protein n=1 Tax=Variibacter gotjawalensis TaxID=1333996 RepID=A0A0S3PTH3_9BRAD|nr:hypothetical protein [Variibacter gotjawalensis]NIK49585.1 hypothetical protein [Variibacter gotjawalensis]RZS45596.1 hypothetical protein EV661_3915 [Variibacter gotjawalensis]BAT59269.1 hypothetical protein GJW-30_1_01800 [Variibacter gotjawalensis]